MPKIMPTGKMECLLLSKGKAVPAFRDGFKLYVLLVYLRSNRRAHHVATRINAELFRISSRSTISETDAA